MGPGYDNAVGAAQTGEWLAQSTVGKQLSAAPRIGCVNGDDVEVAREAQVLKTVVENKTVSAEGFDCVAAGADAISVADHCGRAKKFCREQIRFVTRFCRGRKYCLTIRHDDLSPRLLASVTARQYAHLLTRFFYGSGNPFDQWCFSGSPRGYVADAYDRAIEFGRAKGAATIERDARARDGAV